MPVFRSAPPAKLVVGTGHDGCRSTPEQSIQVWNGHFACRPDLKNRLIPNEGFVTINSWRTPQYRCIGETEADSSLLDELLDRALAHQPDRIVVKDWLAWCLQNEANKPGWALFLYSRRKGTGKSTLCQFATRLFGEDNSMTQNSVEKLTGRFNMPILQSKLVISEELMLKPGSTQGNTLKTYITEEETASEIKGQEVQRVRQCCCFLFTSNHMPLWIEADDRRYYVVDTDHEGHTSGPASAEFGAFVRRFREGMSDDRVMAQVYNSLMQHQVSKGFDAKSLNLAKDSNPLMQQIQGASRQVLLDQLEEYLDGSGSFAIPQETLTTLFREEFRANSNQLRHLMTELRWRHQKVKWGSKDYSRAIWVHPDYQVEQGNVFGPDGYKAKIQTSEFEPIEVI